MDRSLMPKPMRWRDVGAVVSAAFLIWCLMIVFAPVSDAQTFDSRGGYGPLPHSLTWETPPDGGVTIAPGTNFTTPACATEVDAWLVNRKLRERRQPGRPGYLRLRQRTFDGSQHAPVSVFFRKHYEDGKDSRLYLWYENHLAISYRRTVKFYWWCG